TSEGEVQWLAKPIVAIFGFRSSLFCFQAAHCYWVVGSLPMEIINVQLSSYSFDVLPYLRLGFICTEIFFVCVQDLNVLP
ncbi:hypothetical protein AMTR_s00510p00009950, partial [Amborella trichopoda]